MIKLWLAAYVKLLTWTSAADGCFFQSSVYRWSTWGAATERTRKGLLNSCDTVLAVLAVSHDSASVLFRTRMSSLTHSHHFSLCTRTKRSSNPTPATLWCLVLVNRFNGPLNVTGLNTINVWACVCCTTGWVGVSTKRQNEFRGIIILNSTDWGSREKCQKWSEMISSCTDLNYISTCATEENN